MSRERDYYVTADVSGPVAVVVRAKNAKEALEAVAAGEWTSINIELAVRSHTIERMPR